MTCSSTTSCGPTGPGRSMTRSSASSRSAGVTVHHFHDLLAEALDQPGAREFLQVRLTTATRFGPALDKPLDLLSGRRPAGLLADLLVGGVLKRDLVPYLHTSPKPVDGVPGRGRLLLRPLPNHLFQRDNSAWIYNSLSINPMAKQARQAGDHQLPAGLQLPSEVSRCRRRHHLRERLRWSTSPPRSRAVTCWSSAIGAVMIGMGERTTPQGVETLRSGCCSATTHGRPGDRR